MTKQNKMQLTIALTILVLLLAAVAATLKDYRNQRIPEPETTAEISKTADFETKEPETAAIVSQTTETTTETTTEATESTQVTEEAYIPPETQKTTQESSSRGTATFYYNDGEAVYISAEEYYTIAGIVMNEAGYGTYEGCVAVAQAIRNQIIREKHLGHKYDIESVRQTYQMWYTKKPNDQSRRATTDVFYNHIVVTEEPIIAWCATGHASPWHAQQVEVCSFGGNTFYKLATKDW